jgi:hypothetical protein
MSKQVTVDELREKLDELIAEVESGETVTIVPDSKKTERSGPTFAQRGIPFPFRDFDPGPPLKLPVDAVATLIEEREYERSGKKYGL